MEIGAGTGYNAALLDVLVGTDGAVTTIDLLPAAVREARETLRRRPRPREGVPRRRRVRPSGHRPLRPALGPDPVAGPFLGPPAWHRVSELWLDPEPDADLAFEADVRLTDYLRKRKPLRR
ncbi:hypothetical protein AB0J63_46705 [Streptosporangium canum]|uniref:hypothetical protein n=1 Tax=Streptosporangium canum TaxID=324952 RepID=UPI00341E365D